MSSVRCDNVTRLYPEGGGIRRFSCEIHEGECFALLGPSGCGKTTTLRLIAGLETPDAGAIFFDGRDMAGVPPEQRSAAMVFQHYALFPHMNVFENVAFGLRALKTPKPEIADRVRGALELVQLEGFDKRPVTDLSGGQQQRVALARAIVIQPAILLLDEPLSNLDVELRRSTRVQLADLQRRLGITTLYVTHDQEEALALADRIAILKDGDCHQIGTPDELSHAPATPFIETFLEPARRVWRQQ